MLELKPFMIQLCASPVFLAWAKANASAKEKVALLKEDVGAEDSLFWLRARRWGFLLFRFSGFARGNSALGFVNDASFILVSTGVVRRRFVALMKPLCEFIRVVDSDSPVTHLIYPRMAALVSHFEDRKKWGGSDEFAQVVVRLAGDRWKKNLHSPVHSAAYLLDPHCAGEAGYADGLDGQEVSCHMSALAVVRLRFFQSLHFACCVCFGKRCSLSRLCAFVILCSASMISRM
jgi:hypothetical protein